jgi:UDP-glucose 4-epimerase
MAARRSGRAPGRDDQPSGGMQKMKVMVTGGAGFIGSNLVDRLIDEGHGVVVVDDLSTGREENLNPDATFYRQDIRDESLEAVFAREGIEAIFHLAAQMDVRKSVADPVYDARVNILGTINLLESALKHGLKKFVYASTGGAVYGEPRFIPVTEDHPINPDCQYGISKHTVEHYLHVYHRLQGLNWTALRYPNVFGPRQNPHGEAGVVAIFIQLLSAGRQCTIFGDGSKTRDYVYIDDVVEANIIALERGDNACYNLGWGKEVSDVTIFDTVRGALGLEVEPRYEDVRAGEIFHICLEASKIRKQLGWAPNVSLEDGVARTIEWYRRTGGVGR